jgi:hypothetical protein
MIRVLISAVPFRTIRMMFPEVFEAGVYAIAISDISRNVLKIPACIVGNRRGSRAHNIGVERRVTRAKDLLQARLYSVVAVFRPVAISLPVTLTIFLPRA